MVKVARAATQAWEAAWLKSATPNFVAQQYHAEATMVQFGGALISGQPALREFMDSLRTRVREATLAFTDFDAGEGIAYIYGPLFLQPRRAGPMANGQHLTVLRRERSGYLIRSQMFIGKDSTGSFPRLPAHHPSGPLTVQAMKNAGTVARYRSANDVLNQLHVAWSRADTAGVFNLLASSALVHLPGEEMGLRGAPMRAAISALLQRAGDLHFVTLDYDSSGRLGALFGQYYMEVRGGTPFVGYFGLIVTWQENGWKVRSLVFA